MAVLDQTYKQEIFDIQIDYKLLKQKTNKTYSDDIKNYIESVEAKLLRWIRFDLEYPNDVVIKQQNILSNLLSYDIFNIFIRAKRDIFNIIHASSSESEITSQIDTSKSLIQSRFERGLDNYWQYDLYVISLLGTDRKLIAELEKNLNYLIIK